MSGRVPVPSAFDMSAGDLRAAVRLALELRDFPAGDPAQRLHFLQGAAKIVGAHVAMWLEVDGLSKPRPTIISATEHGWSSPEQRASFLAYLEAQHDAPDPALPQIVQAWDDNALMTSMRRQLVADAEWYRSDHVDRFRRGARVDDCIYSIAPNTGIPALGFHRAWGDKPYTERARAVIYALHAECLRLFDTGEPLRLSGRQREVVNLLVQGLSEKEVADKMGISVSTAHGYIKILHKRLKVHSRGELLAVVAGRTKPGGDR